MKKHLLLAFVVLFVVWSVGAQTSDKRLTGLEKELNAVLNSWQGAGFAVAIVEKDKLIYSKGFGYRDYEKKVAVTPNTLFAIGSCSKAFTTTLLGKLADENKISLDEKPATYIPGFHFKKPEMDNTISIRDLMCHRTGLPRHDYSWYLFPSNSKDSLLQRVAFQEPFAGVREKWYYNNFMFLAQGVIVEKVTGKSWEDNVREQIFQPLGMSRSNLSIDEMEATADISIGYEVKDDSLIKQMDYYHIAGMSPAGSINSSVNEMANWVIAWINGGKFKGQQVIPATFLQQAMSSQMVINPALPEKEHPDIFMANYGYGWFINSYKGHYRVEHGGNIDGFSASSSFFPADSIGIIVLSNQNGSPIPGMVRNIVSDRMLRVTATDWNQEFLDRRAKNRKAEEDSKANRSSNQKTGTKPSHLLAEYIGSYNHPGYGTFELELINDSLFAQLPLKKLWLKHYHYDIFEVYEVEKTGINDKEPSDLHFSFSTGVDGEIAGLSAKIEPAIDPIIFKRKPKTVTLDTEALEKYAGTFDMSGTEIKFFVKGKNSLHLTVPGQPEYELLPLGGNSFAIKTLEGFKVEFEEEQGQYPVAVFRQPNGVFRAKRK